MQINRKRLSSGSYSWRWSDRKENDFRKERTYFKTTTEKNRVSAQMRTLAGQHLAAHSLKKREKSRRRSRKDFCPPEMSHWCFSVNAAKAPHMLVPFHAALYNSCLRLFKISVATKCEVADEQWWRTLCCTIQVIVATVGANVGNSHKSTALPMYCKQSKELSVCRRHKSHSLWPL